MLMSINVSPSCARACQLTTFLIVTETCYIQHGTDPSFSNVLDNNVVGVETHSTTLYSDIACITFVLISCGSRSLIAPVSQGCI